MPLRCCFWLCCLVLSSPIRAQVELKQDAVVYFGSATKATAPATIDEDQVKQATTEWKTIQAEGVRRGSARYLLLTGQMDKRIREAVRSVVAEASKDLVVRAGDVTDAKGKNVVDLTAEVARKIDKTP